MASDVSICNAGLALLGAGRITSLTENSVAARTCNEAYERTRDAELRGHPWGFAIKRVQLAADATAPIFGKTNSFTLPSDFLRLLEPDPNSNDNDWMIENNNSGISIVTNYDAPLNVRYIARITDANVMDALFREALSASLAAEMCEALTQSNTKKQIAESIRSAKIREAKRVNAIERPAQTPPEDIWVTARA